MVAESDLQLQVYQACAFGNSARMHPTLSDRLEEFGPRMTQRQRETLVALAAEHIGSLQITNDKWTTCAELVEAINLLYGIRGAVEVDDGKIELWAKDDTYFFTADTTECHCSRALRDRKFCFHLMTLALVLAGME